MSHLQIQQLILIKGEYQAAQASVNYTEREWSRLRWEQNFSRIEFRQVRQATANVEATYIVRLFSVFEGILRAVLPVRVASSPDRRSVYDLINRCASKWRIPTLLRDEVHRIREFRNQAVHQSDAAAPLLFADALAGLNRFLAWLPDTL